MRQQNRANDRHAFLNSRYATHSKLRLNRDGLLRGHDKHNFRKQNFRKQNFRKHNFRKQIFRKQHFRKQNFMKQNISENKISLTCCWYGTHEGATLGNKMAVHATRLHYNMSVTAALPFPLSSSICQTMSSDRETDITSFCEKLPPVRNENRGWRIVAMIIFPVFTFIISIRIFQKPGLTSRKHKTNYKHNFRVKELWPRVVWRYTIPKSIFVKGIELTFNTCRV